MICSIEEFNSLNSVLQRPLIIDSTNDGLITCHIATNEEMCIVRTAQIKNEKKTKLKLISFCLDDRSAGTSGSQFDFVDFFFNRNSTESLARVIQYISNNQKIGVIKEHRAATGYGLAESKHVIDYNWEEWKAAVTKFLLAYPGEFGVIDYFKDRRDDDDTGGVINRFTLLT